MTFTLVFDVETTGIPVRGEVVTSPSYPHLVELAAVLVDAETERELASFSFVVKPTGWVIPDEAVQVHGISQGMAMEIGVPLSIAIASYTNLRAVADELAGHNVAFDLGIVAAALHRIGRTPASPGPDRVTCTAELGTPVCRLPPTERMVAAGYGDRFKKPKLEELYRALFNEELVGAHGALADCRAAARCLFELRRRNG